MNKKEDKIAFTLRLKKDLSNVIAEKADDIGISKQAFIITILQKELNNKEIS